MRVTRSTVVLLLAVLYLLPGGQAVAQERELRVYPEVLYSNDMVTVVAERGGQPCLDDPNAFQITVDGENLGYPVPPYTRVPPDGFLIQAFLGDDPRYPAPELTPGAHTLEMRCQVDDGELVSLGTATITVQPNAFEVGGPPTLGVVGVRTAPGATINTYVNNAGCAEPTIQFDGAAAEVTSSERFELDGETWVDDLSVVTPSGLERRVYLVEAFCPDGPIAPGRALPIYVEGEPIAQPSPQDTLAATEPASPAPSATPSPSEETVAPPGGDPPRSPLNWDLPTPSEVLLDPVSLGRSLLVTLAVLFLIGFPAELVNKTIEENRDVFTLRRPSGGGGYGGAIPFLAFIALAAVLGVASDPTAGLSSASLIAAFCLMATLTATTLVYALPGEALARLLTPVRARLVAVPTALVLAVLCAGLSRTAALAPPYLYGVFAAYLTTRDRGLDRRAKGGAVLAGALATLAVSLLAWALLDDLHRPAATRLETIAATLCAQVFVVGIESLMFGLIPLRFMDGATLRSWSRAAWVAMYAVAAFCFIHVLVFTRLEVIEQDRVPDFARTLALFLAFGLGSVLFWGYFALRAKLRHVAQGPSRRAVRSRRVL